MCFTITTLAMLIQSTALFLLDLDECSASTPVCDVNANCQNNVGSYICSCKTGFAGDGKTCNGKMVECNKLVKAAKYEIQKLSTCRATLFRCKFSSMFPVFHLSCNKNIFCGLTKVVAKSLSRARVYFEQQILVLLLVFHQTHNLSCNKFARALANQPISAPHFFKLIAQGEKREKWTKTCNKTMLRDKLRVFGFRVSPLLERCCTV